MMNAPDFEQLKECFPRYDFVRPLSTGVVPFTYLLQHQTLDKELVLYLVPNDMLDQIGWTPQFLAKAKQACQLKHPSLLTVEETGICQEYHYIVVENGKDPKVSDMASHFPMKPYAALDAVKSLATGLQEAHALGVFHGRLDRQSIQMNSRYFCRVLPINLRPGVFFGEEAEYYAPEALSRGMYSPEAGDDTYSLGILLYTFLTGSLPSSHHYVMPSCVSDCSKTVDSVLERAISPEYGSRFSTMSSLIESLGKSMNKAEKEAEPFGLKSTENRKIIIYGGGTLTYFYLIPLLLIGILMAVLVLQYKNELNEITEKRNELIRQIKIIKVIRKE